MKPSASRVISLRGRRPSAKTEMPTSEREVGKAGRSSSTQSTNGRWKGCGGRIEVGEAHARIAVGMKLPRERGNLGVAFEPMQSAAST